MQVVQKTLLNIARRRNKDNYNELNPLVSVRIPTKNRGELLIERAVSSALEQTYQNFEIVIVGDNCTDNTEELLLQENDSRIRFYNLPPRSKKEIEFLKDPKMRWFTGPVRPTNKANELIKGKWIAHIDDDDTWTRSHIEDLLRFAQKGNYEFVSANYVAERYGKRKIVSNGGQTWLYRSYLKLFKYNKNCWKNKWNKVSDTDVYDRMKRAGVRMGHLNKVVAYVLPRPGEKTIGLEVYQQL